MRLPDLNSFITWLEVSVRSHCTQLGWCAEVSARPGDPTQVTPPPCPALAQPGGSHRQRAVPWGGGQEQEGDSAGLVCVKAGQEEGARPQVDQTPAPRNTHTYPLKVKNTLSSSAAGREEEVCLLGMELGLVTGLNSRLSRERELNSCVIHTADPKQVSGDSGKRGAVSPEPGEEPSWPAVILGAPASGPAEAARPQKASEKVEWTPRFWTGQPVYARPPVSIHVPRAFCSSVY